MSKYEELGKVAKEAFEEVTKKSAKSKAAKPAVNVNELKRRVMDIDAFWYQNDMAAPIRLYNKNQQDTMDAFDKIRRWQGPDRPESLDEFVEWWNNDTRERARLLKQIKKALGKDWDTGY